MWLLEDLCDGLRCTYTPKTASSYTRNSQIPMYSHCMSLSVPDYVSLARWSRDIIAGLRHRSLFDTWRPVNPVNPVNSFPGLLAWVKKAQPVLARGVQTIRPRYVPCVYGGGCAWMQVCGDESERTGCGLVPGWAAGSISCVIHTMPRRTPPLIQPQTHFSGICPYRPTASTAVHTLIPSCKASVIDCYGI